MGEGGGVKRRQGESERAREREEKVGVVKVGRGQMT